MSFHSLADLAFCQALARRGSADARVRFPEPSRVGTGDACNRGGMTGSCPTEGRVHGLSRRVLGAYLQCRAYVSRCERRTIALAGIGYRISGGFAESSCCDRGSGTGVAWDQPGDSRSQGCRRDGRIRAATFQAARLRHVPDLHILARHAEEVARRLGSFPRETNACFFPSTERACCTFRCGD